MTKHYLDDDAVAHVGLGLLDRTLPKAEWTHAAHFAAALWLLRSRPDLPLAERMAEIIRAYNEATDTPNTDSGGYHETITRASMTAAISVLSHQPAARPLHEVVDVLMATELGRSDWPLAYWSKATLFSVEARRAWVGPDLQPLPQRF
ncbi:hypothetical protein [Phenylobacterium aquaticum]|uniref:hypothetical protein n=1 Tax=Phenylobacterium aquaticum TaxID=1763816 RepID=UPI0026F12B84|nr:hypothetical protein [Phenylobacterium aquaticum]